MMSKTRRGGCLSGGRPPRLSKCMLRRKNKRVNPYAGTICQRYFSNTRCITVKSIAKLGIKFIQRDLLIDGKEHPTNLTNSVISMRISNVRTTLPYKPIILSPNSLAKSNIAAIYITLLFSPPNRVRNHSNRI